MQNVQCKMQNRNLALCILHFWLLMTSIFAASATTVAAKPTFLPWDSLKDGWISLFDGETLYGWQPVGDAKWEVADGEIRTRGDKAGWLMTTTEWANYELYAEFKAESRTNSGIFLHTVLKPTDPTKDCVELNIAPEDNPFPTGSLVGRKKAGHPLRRLTKAGEWHTFEMSSMDGRNEVRLDREQVLDYTDSKPRRIGFIGLQSREGAVAFRKLALRPRGLKAIFTGYDLTGWSTDRAEKSKFDVGPGGELRLENGPGQIDTKADFTNFVLQLECKVNGDGLNSGIFFRTLRKGRWAGYESQIQNGFKDGDRTKPKDFGTGAIYRRQAARYVVPNDREWFTKTIVVDGPHFAVWVNGYQVSDWTDTRPEKESGREGLRLGGGAIAIQGHDRTTDFLFRNIRAVELPR